MSRGQPAFTRLPEPGRKLAFRKRLGSQGSLHRESTRQGSPSPEEGICPEDCSHRGDDHRHVPRTHKKIHPRYIYYIDKENLWMLRTYRDVEAEEDEFCNEEVQQT